MLQLRPVISQVVGRSILITGVARSGTSIMGTLVHSLSGVELVFEPPLLYALFPLLGQMDAATWKFLYESYLFEDFLADALAGRRSNFNRWDDSGIQKVKSIQDVDARLDSRYRRLDLFREACNHRVAYKMPDILPWVNTITGPNFYPEMQCIIMFREPEAVVDSLLKKHWFSDDGRSSDVIQGPWNRLAPDEAFWVRDSTEWEDASELEKSYLYYLWQSEALVARNKNYVLKNGIFETMDGKRYCIVNYDDFVREPAQEFQKVIEFVGCSPTPATAELLKTVKYQQNGMVAQTLDKISPELRGRVLNVLKEMGHV